MQVMPYQMNPASGLAIANNYPLYSHFISSSPFAVNPYNQLNNIYLIQYYFKNYYDLYTDRLKKKYPIFYALLHALFLILINVGAIIVHIALYVKRAALFGTYSGFWVNLYFFNEKYTKNVKEKKNYFYFIYFE
jgi:hypothetical protein